MAESKHHLAPHEHELSMLARVAAFLTWFESLAILVSWPLVTVGLGIVWVDLLTSREERSV